MVSYIPACNFVYQDRKKVSITKHFQEKLDYILSNQLNNFLFKNALKKHKIIIPKLYNNDYYHVPYSELEGDYLIRTSEMIYNKDAFHVVQIDTFSRACFFELTKPETGFPYLGYVRIKILDPKRGLRRVRPTYWNVINVYRSAIRSIFFKILGITRPYDSYIEPFWKTGLPFLYERDKFSQGHLPFHLCMFKDCSMMELLDIIKHRTLHPLRKFKINEISKNNTTVVTSKISYNYIPYKVKEETEEIDSSPYLILTNDICSEFDVEYETADWDDYAIESYSDTFYDVDSPDITLEPQDGNTGSKNTTKTQTVYSRDSKMISTCFSFKDERGEDEFETDENQRLLIKSEKPYYSDDEYFFGYKAAKLKNGNPCIVKLAIPKNAKVVIPAEEEKCRTQTAIPIGIFKINIKYNEKELEKYKSYAMNHDLLMLTQVANIYHSIEIKIKNSEKVCFSSVYPSDRLTYELDKQIYIEDFDLDPLKLCAKGIHFHMLIEHALSWHGIRGIHYSYIINYDKLVTYLSKSESKKEI